MAATAGAANKAVSIIISEPQKLGDGLQAYISYKVTATFAEPPPGLDTSTFTVIRRFSDFVWLRGALRDTVPWAIVPCLPEKQQLGRFSPDFVEIRLRALQRWMDKVAASGELATSDPLKKFVTMPYDALAALRDGTRGEMVKSVVAESRTRVMKLLKTASTTISTTIAEVRGGSGGVSSASAGGGYTKGSSADDHAFASIEAYLLGQAGPLTAVYNAAAALAIRYREQAQLLLDHGAALRSLGSTEGGAYGGALSSVGLSTWAASTAAYEQAVQETELWVERLADHVRGIRATKEVIEERSRASAAVGEALAEADRLRALVAALGSNPSPAALQQRSFVEVELNQANAAAVEARGYYDKVAAGVLAEVARYQAETRAEFQQLMTEFAAIQHRAQNKLGRGWERIVPELTSAVSSETGGAYIPVYNHVPVTDAALAAAVSAAATRGAAPPPSATASFTGMFSGSSAPAPGGSAEAASNAAAPVSFGAAFTGSSAEGML